MNNTDSRTLQFPQPQLRKVSVAAVNTAPSSRRGAREEYVHVTGARVLATFNDFLAYLILNKSLT